MKVEKLKQLLAERGHASAGSKEGLVGFLAALDMLEVARAAGAQKDGLERALAAAAAAAAKTAAEEGLHLDDDEGCSFPVDGDGHGATPTPAPTETEPESPPGPQPPTTIDPAAGPTEAVPVAAAAKPAVDGAPTALADEERVADSVEAAVAKALADERAASKEREDAAFWKGERSGMTKAVVFLVLLCVCWWNSFERS